METSELYNKISEITKEDNRYSADAYIFVNESISYTIEKINGENKKHISGNEVLEGVIDFAIKKYGPLASNVFKKWGIEDGVSIGNIVFNMVQHNILSTKDSDSLEDFRVSFDIFAELQAPFKPSGKRITNIPVIA